MAVKYNEDLSVPGAMILCKYNSKNAEGTMKTKIAKELTEVRYTRAMNSVVIK